MKTTLFTITSALLLTVVALPAEAEPVDPFENQSCTYVYHEEQVGPVTVIRRDSCAAPEVEVDDSFSGHGLPGPAPVYCAQMYSEEEVGPVTIVRRSSCAAPEIQVSDDFSGPEAPTLYCMQVYSEYEVGPVTVVRRNSCAVPEITVSDGFSHPGNPLPLYCAQVYSEQDAGPVTIVQSSSCSVPRVQPDEDFDAGSFSGPSTDPGCTWNLQKMDVAGQTVVVPGKCQATDGL